MIVMFELNQTSAYEPPPLWGCRHDWMLIGDPIVTWVSGGTGDKPSENAPVMQKRQCLNCGGFEWVGAQT